MDVEHRNLCLFAKEHFQRQMHMNASNEQEFKVSLELALLEYQLTRLWTDKSQCQSIQSRH